MRIGFTGTRNGMTPLQGAAIARLLCGVVGELHHGDCVGADAQAAELAKRNGIKTVAHPPINETKRAFFQSDETREAQSFLARNRRIVMESEWVIVAPGEKEPQLRSGTWSTFRFAAKCKRKIYLVYPDGEVSRVGPH